MISASFRLRLAGLSLAGALLLAACADATPNTPVPAVPSSTPSPAVIAPAATDTAAPPATAAPPTATLAPADTATLAPAPAATAPPAATDTQAALPPASIPPAPPTASAAPPPSTVTSVPAATSTAPPAATSVPPPAATGSAPPPAATDTAPPAATATAPPAATGTAPPAATATPAGPTAWQLVSPAIKDLRAPLTSAPDGTLYAGGNGVYRSTDAGRTWAALTTAFPVQDIAVARAAPDVIYAGRGEGCASGIPGGLYRSTDRGATWTPITAGPFQVQANSPDPNIVLALRCDGVYRSANGGQTWPRLIAGGGGLSDALFLARGVNDPGYLYAVYVSEGGSPTLQRSTNGGATWKTLPAVDQPAPNSFVVDPKDAKHVYFLGGAGFLASADGGQTWHAHNNGFPPAGQGYALSNLALDTVSTPPRGATATLYLASGRPPARVFRWNGVDSWVLVAPAPDGQAIYQLLVVHDAAGPALLALTRAGLYRLPLH